MMVPVWVFAEDKPQPGIISVSGMGEVSAKPDMAVINAGVTTKGENAKECYTANSETMNRIYSELKAAGITDDNIKTEVFSLQPQISYPNRPNEREKIVGYTLTHIFNVEIQDIKKSGEIIDKLSRAGATNIGNVQFKLKDSEKYRSLAREKAVTSAKTKAEELAKGAGVALGRIMSISEDNFRPLYPLHRDMGMKAMAAEAAPAPVMEGELKVSVSVHMSYEIKQ